MCGFFGFITKDGSGPNLDRLRLIAIQTQRRGHHAFGLASIGHDDASIRTSGRAPPRRTWATSTPAVAPRW
jgi:hypothetical protein